LGIAIEDVTNDQRRQAKAVNFGLLYGMSEFGLTRQLGFTVKNHVAILHVISNAIQVYWTIWNVHVKLRVSKVL
jgi:DNA polymerase I-like protein with 3'-5' exonuclease and polymerase domains